MAKLKVGNGETDLLKTERGLRDEVGYNSSPGWM